MGASFPAQPQPGQQVAQLLAVEDHALHDAVHKGLQRAAGQTSFRCCTNERTGARFQDWGRIKRTPRQKISSADAVVSVTNQAEFSSLIQEIQQARPKVFAQANTALIDLYRQIGKTISHKVQTEAWGKGVVSELAQYITQNDPTIKGFSDKNLWWMKQFYETYHADAELVPLIKALPWTQNTIIFARCKTAEERVFYLQLCLKEQYISRELERQIDAAQFERTLLSNQKLSAVLRELHPTIGNTFKDNYVLEFLGLPPVYSENRLQKALVRHMKQFILELGKEFIFMGEEYRLQVGNQDFFIDLLFFHRDLAPLVAFELKIGKFMPEYIGQINFYLEALERMAA